MEAHSRRRVWDGKQGIYPPYYLLKVLDHFTNCFKSFAGGYCTTTVEAIDIDENVLSFRNARHGNSIISSMLHYSMHPSEMLPKLLTHQDDVGSKSSKVRTPFFEREWVVRIPTKFDCAFVGRLYKFKCIKLATRTAHRKEAGHAPDCPITSWDDSAIASQADQLCYERFRVFMLWKST
ncbi:hypothetical protein C8Q75DRAFT_730293 [Abortiporus biennis]|nr:hypothetical protein C8Q75DRAFT_730293 [Abortiporus biennis]